MYVFNLLYCPVVSALFSPSFRCCKDRQPGQIAVLPQQRRLCLRLGVVLGFTVHKHNIGHISPKVHLTAENLMK